MDDTSWDRKYFYSCDSINYVLNLATLFSKYVHVIRPDSKEDGCESSSLGRGGD